MSNIILKNEIFYTFNIFVLVKFYFFIYLFSLLILMLFTKRQMFHDFRVWILPTSEHSVKMTYPYILSLILFYLLSFFLGFSLSPQAHYYHFLFFFYAQNPRYTAYRFIRGRVKFSSRFTTTNVIFFAKKNWSSVEAWGKKKSPFILHCFLKSTRKKKKNRTHLFFFFFILSSHFLSFYFYCSIIIIFYY